MEQRIFRVGKTLRYYFFMAISWTIIGVGNFILYRQHSTSSWHIIVLGDATIVILSLFFATLRIHRPMIIDDQSITATFLPWTENRPRIRFAWQIKRETIFFADIVTATQRNLPRFGTRFKTIKLNLTSGRQVYILMTEYLDRQRSEIWDAIYQRLSVRQPSIASAEFETPVGD